MPVEQSLHALGLNVVCDVVYNHTFAAGPWSHNAVLDKVVPGYYHRCVQWRGCLRQMVVQEGFVYG